MERPSSGRPSQTPRSLSRAITWGNEHGLCLARPCATPAPLMGFVDLHSHVLYGLDDGATSEAASLAMLDGLATLGVTEQCLTPHQKAGQYLPSWDRIE